MRDLLNRIASEDVVDRAIARGELEAPTDPNLLIETLIGPLDIRPPPHGRANHPTVADQVAALVAAGAQVAVPGSTRQR